MPQPLTWKKLKLKGSMKTYKDLLRTNTLSSAIYEFVA